jgi:hypothetical protein
MKNTMKAIKELTPKERILLVVVGLLFLLFSYVDGTYGLH